MCFVGTQTSSSKLSSSQSSQRAFQAFLCQKVLDLEPRKPVMEESTDRFTRISWFSKDFLKVPFLN